MRLRDVLAALIWGAAAGLGALQLSLTPAVVAAFLGGVAGCLGASLLSRTRLRTGAVLLGALLLFPVLQALARAPAGTPWLCGMVGAEPALVLSEVLVWLFMTLLGVGLLHFVGQRHPFWSGLEVAAVAALAASPFAAHREGFINRPYFLVDPLWSRGYDPVPVLLMLGACAGALMAFLVLGRTTRRAAWIDGLLLLALLSLLFAFVPARRIRDIIPEPAGGYGLTGAPKNWKEREEKGGGRPPDEMPMEDQGPGQGVHPLAVVLLHDDYTPPGGYYYFRQNAYSAYNGRRLVTDVTGKFDQDLPSGFPASGATLSVPPPPYDPRFVRRLETTVALLVSHTRPLGLVTPEHFLSQRNPDPDQFWKAYRVVSTVPLQDDMAYLGLSAGNPAWTEEQKAYFTRVPDDPRYRELAEKIVKGLPDRYQGLPFAKALIIKLWLEKEGIYSLKSRHAHAQDPVADFLFGDKTGYCVHFAHAACYLFRSLGVPARVGAGYIYDARARGGGSNILLRSGDSHAWAEVYLEGAGWVVVDIAPERSQVEMMGAPDPDLQRMLGQMARDEKDESRGERKNLQELLARLFRLGLAGLAVLAVLSILGLYIAKVWRRLAPYYGPDQDRLRRTYRAGLDCLSEVGRRRGYGQGRLEFAQRLSQEFPTLLELTRMHLDRTMGRPGEGPPAREALLLLYVNLQEEVRRAIPRGTRLAGLLNPFTWLWVK
ncbi:MAG: transglutaminase-like domain-containing protein [Candidatus Eremiobacterota bacterium]